MRNISLILIILILCFGTSNYTVPQAIGEEFEADDHILFVHGLFGQGVHMSWLRTAFIEDGWDITQLHADSFSDPNNCSSDGIIANAYQIKEWVDTILEENPTENKIEIIGHSLGGVSSRYYLKFLGGAEKVNNYIALGSPQHLHYEEDSIVDFCYDEEYQSQEGYINFYNDLNNGDESPYGRMNDTIGHRASPSPDWDISYNGSHTPGGVNYVTIATTADALLPVNVSALDGAINLVVDEISHSGLAYSPEVYNLIVENMTPIEVNYTSTPDTTSVTSDPTTSSDSVNSSSEIVRSSQETSDPTETGSSPTVPLSLVVVAIVMASNRKRRYVDI
ncbi:MAG: esterase/lipase family protein [Candidatus Kariarchaeaceae archaeon]|jgi:triacylglycerol lipase